MKKEFEEARMRDAAAGNRWTRDYTSRDDGLVVTMGRLDSVEMLGDTALLHFEDGTVAIDDRRFSEVKRGLWGKR